MQIYTCSWDPYRRQWSWFRNETATGLQGTLWMPSSGQQAIYCNRAKSFHLESPDPESCKICSYLMQKIYTSLLLLVCALKQWRYRMWTVLQQKAAGSSEMSINFYHTTYCHIPHKNNLQTHCDGGILNKLWTGRWENNYQDQVRKSTNITAGKGMVPAQQCLNDCDCINWQN